MARVSTVLCASHSPFLFAAPEEWEPARAARSGRSGIAASEPVDSVAENHAKHARCIAAYGVLREKLAAAKPDVLLIFGDDQYEQFNFSNLPAFALYVGAEFSGFKISRSFGLPLGVPRPDRPKTPEHWVTVRNHPELAQQLVVELIDRGFDLAFSKELSRPEEGMGHAFMRPCYYLLPNYDLPIVPFSINCYFGPQPRARRCYELGRAIRAALEAIPLELNVAVLGSGGLWHTPNYPNSRLDQTFDRAMLDTMASGDARAMAAAFDRYEMEYDHSDPNGVKLASAGSGMLLGLGGGGGETRNWIAAAGVADGKPATIVDYVPVHASPLGAGFAYWENV